MSTGDDRTLDDALKSIDARGILGELCAKGGHSTFDELYGVLERAQYQLPIGGCGVGREIVSDARVMVIRDNRVSPRRYS